MIGEILGAGASLIGGALGSIGAAKANAANAKQAQLNRDFQERMSSTSWQRGVADMKAAGLNPALAYEKGGASSPSGSSAQMENTLNSLGAGVAGASSAAQAARMNNQALAASKAQTIKTLAEAKQTSAMTDVGVALAKAQLESTQATSAYTVQRTQTERAESLSRELDNIRKQLENEQVPERLKLSLAQARADLQRALNDNSMFGVRKAIADAQLIGVRLENTYAGRSLGSRLLQVANQAELTGMSSARQAVGLQMDTYGLPRAKAESDVYRTPLGKWLPYLSTARDAVGASMSLGRSLGWP